MNAAVAVHGGSDKESTCGHTNGIEARRRNMKWTSLTPEPVALKCPASTASTGIKCFRLLTM
eukprot:1897547-Pleurochrysis_carterae.AAC.1